MEREVRPNPLSGDEAKMLNKFFPAPDQMGGRHLNVERVPDELDSKIRELEKRGIVMFLNADALYTAGWFLTDQGFEALTAAKRI